MSRTESPNAPNTVGELRKRLKAMGNPWGVLPHLNDDDPLPQPPRGGMPVEPAHFEGVTRIDAIADYEKHVHAHPPSNPVLARHWHQAGIPGAPHAAQPATAPGQPQPEWGVA